MDRQEKAVELLDEIIEIYKQAFIQLAGLYEFVDLSAAEKAMSEGTAPKRLVAYHPWVFQTLPGLRDRLKVDTEIQLTRLQTLVEECRFFVSLPVTESTDLSAIFSSFPNALTEMLRKHGIVS